MAKSSTNKILIAAAIAAGGYMLLSKKSSAASNGYPLQYGVVHPDIIGLQSALGVAQDGVIGPQTLAKLSGRKGRTITAAEIPTLYPTQAALFAEIKALRAGNGLLMATIKNHNETTEMAGIPTLQ